MCILGDRLLSTKAYTINGIAHCTKDKFCFNPQQNESSSEYLCPLYKIYCAHSANDTFSNSLNDFSNCDPYFSRNKVFTKKAFPGFPRAFFG